MSKIKQRMNLIFYLCFIVLLIPSLSYAGFLYALNDDFSVNYIYGFSVDETTGALTALAGFPVATGGTGYPLIQPERMVYDPLNSRLYVVNDGSDTVSAFSVDTSTGALTALPFSPISLGGGTWGCISVHPSGSPLVVADANSSSVLSFNITPTTATLATGSPYSSGTQSFSCSFSRDGNYFYTGGNAGTEIAGFSVNSGTGVLTPLAGSPFDSGGSFPLAYATDAQGRLFISDYDNGVRAFTTPAGIPTSVTGNPFASGILDPVYGILHSAGFYMVANLPVSGTGSVGVYQIAGTGASTTLTAVTGSPFASGGNATGILALNSTGNYLFAANTTSRNITTFTVNQTNGSLSILTTQAPSTLGGSSSSRINGLAYVPEPAPAPPPTMSVPTITEWGMIVFIVLAGLGAVYYMRRQKAAKS